MSSSERPCSLAAATSEEEDSSSSNVKKASSSLLPPAAAGPEPRPVEVFLRIRPLVEEETGHDETTIQVSSTKSKLRIRNDGTEGSASSSNNNNRSSSAHSRGRHGGGGNRRGGGGVNKNKQSQQSTMPSNNKTSLSSFVATYGHGTYCPASKGKATSTKRHDAPLTKRDLYFSLHCDMVAVSAPSSSPSQQKTNVCTPGRVTLINWDNEVVLDTFVEIDVPVVDFYDTGITPSDVVPQQEVENGKNRAVVPLSSVQTMLELRLRGKILIGHGLAEDLSALGIDHPLSDRRDCGTYESFGYEEMDGVSMTNVWTPKTLDELSVEHLNNRTLPAPGQPLRAVQCCVTALELYKKYRKEWEESLAAKARESTSTSTSTARPATQRKQQHLSQTPCVAQTPPLSNNSNNAIGSIVDIVSLHCLMVKTASRPFNVARVTMLSSTYEIILDTYVRIPGRVIDCYDTGIVWDDVSARSNPTAMAYSDVRQTVKSLLRGKLLVGCNIDRHLKALDLGDENDPGHPFMFCRDVATFRPFMFQHVDEASGIHTVSERPIDDLSAEFLQSAMSSPGDRRRPVDCCIASLELYKLYRNQWEGMLPEDQRFYPRTSPAVTDGYTPTGPQPKGQSMEQSQRSSSSNSSWFAWGRRTGSETNRQHVGGPSNFSDRAFQVLNDHNQPTLFSPDSYDQGSSYYDGSASYLDSSTVDGSHYGYPASAGSYSYYTSEGSAVSSLHDDASSVFSGDADIVPTTPSSAAQSKSSSWFRFGSRKSRYSSPTSRVSMMAVEEADEPDELNLTPSAVQKSPSRSRSILSFGGDSEDAPNAPSMQDDGNLHDPYHGQSTSRSWFGFRRRGSISKVTRPASPPLTPDTKADTAEDSVREPSGRFTSTSPLTSDGGGSVASNSEKAEKHDHESSVAANQANTHERKSSLSWFAMRRSKSPVASKKVVDIAEDSMTTFVSDLERSATEPTEKSNDDWLQEVMSQSESQGNVDDISSVGFQPWLDQADGVSSEREHPSKTMAKSRGQTSWFGLMRRDSTARKGPRLSDSPESLDENANDADEMPASITPSILAKDRPTQPSIQEAAAPQYHSALVGSSAWMLSYNRELSDLTSTTSSPAVPRNRTASADSVEDSIVRDAFFSGGRDRLNTASTLPTVTSDGATGSHDYEDDIVSGSSSEDFSLQFEQGVVQNLAFLEI
mmetsp:Transcript_31861/g.77391  ORF Transcript_31861/g.77391 Transcript_31861/m.77391 type:complete len:1190 (-) Transcript_31861:931-4500(-)